jgi:hypothetical protein
MYRLAGAFFLLRLGVEQRHPILEILWRLVIAHLLKSNQLKKDALIILADLALEQEI